METSKVEYLGAIIEDGVNYKLFKCNRKLDSEEINVTNKIYEHNDILYFKYSKKNKSSEIIYFRDYLTKKESQIRKLLRSRIVCPRFDEHSKRLKIINIFLYVLMEIQIDIIVYVMKKIKRIDMNLLLIIRKLFL